MTENTITCLRIHAAKYPKMLPQDAVKLLFQNEFGGGHLISDPEITFARLQEEYSQTKHNSSTPLLEDIGNGMVRVMLEALNITEYSLETLNQDFAHSAQLHVGDPEQFLHKLDLLRDLTCQGVLPFSPEALEEYLAQYIASGCPAVSHSQTYRDAYHPAYRVVCKNCLPAEVILLHSLRQLPVPASRPLLIAIDGRCASGKTRLAAQIQNICGCSVVHMDDFFLRPEQRTKERYETPGENVDHERFLEEILLPLSRGESVRYRPFHCSTQQLGQPIVLLPTSIVIVEGSYSCHPSLRPYYDLRAFLTIDPKPQMERITAREGEEYAQVFRNKWIPLEELYFAALQPEKTCDLILYA